MEVQNIKTEIQSLHDKYVLKTYASSKDIVFVKGKGAVLYDISGKKYLDFASGISVCNLGHCHPAVTDAIRKQVKRLVHVSNLYLNDRQPELAAKLISKGFDGRVFFCNSGAEANEGLIKFARKYGNPSCRNKIVVMDSSFHGRTLATLAATGRSKYREGFQPDMPGFIQAKFNDISSVESVLSDDVCAILVEPVQGEGGVIPAKKEFLQSLRRICDERDMLLLFDEVQCGMGRTGHFFAWQSYGVEPDALSLAKALGNGYPIGAFIVKRKYENIFTPGTHGSTFGGTPLACAAACAVIDAMDNENVLENCKVQSEYIFAKLSQFAQKTYGIKELRGRGLMIGLDIEAPASEIRKLAEQAGLLILTAGENVLRLLPPLTIQKKQIDKGLQILEMCFKKMKGT